MSKPPDELVTFVTNKQFKAHNKRELTKAIQRISSVPVFLCNDLSGRQGGGLQYNHGCVRITSLANMRQMNPIWRKGLVKSI